MITDNGKEFYNKAMDKLCLEYKFKQHNSSMNHKTTNDLVEEFNKTLCNLLKNIMSHTRKDWHVVVKNHKHMVLDK